MKKNYQHPAATVIGYLTGDAIAASPDDINGNPDAGDIVDGTL